MTYRRGILALNEFRQTSTMTDVWPVPLEDLCKFTAYLFQTNLSHSTIKCYLSGISFF